MRDHVLSLAYLLYTDPGSGALLLQILIGGAVGALFHFRRFLARIFRRSN